MEGWWSAFVAHHPSIMSKQAQSMCATQATPQLHDCSTALCPSGLCCKALPLNHLGQVPVYQNQVMSLQPCAWGLPTTCMGSLSSPVWHHRDCSHHLLQLWRRNTGNA